MVRTRKGGENGRESIAALIARSRASNHEGGTDRGAVYLRYAERQARAGAVKHASRGTSAGSGEGRPMPREAAYADERSQDGEAMSASE